MNHILEKIVNKVMSQSEEMRVFNLSTLDGFTHYTLRADGYDTGDDKLSAVSSSLLSLSHAATRQLMKSELINTVIEAVDGNMILIKTQYKQQDAVLCLITSTDLILGKARYFATKIAEAIAKISEDK